MRGLESSRTFAAADTNLNRGPEWATQLPGQRPAKPLAAFFVHFTADDKASKRPGLILNQFKNYTHIVLPF